MDSPPTPSTPSYQCIVTYDVLGILLLRMQPWTGWGQPWAPRSLGSDPGQEELWLVAGVAHS